MEAYRDMGLPQKIGITLNLSPYYPASEKPEDLKALQRADGFQNRIYLDPVFKGKYPEDLTDALAVIEPLIQPGDMELISKPIDFLGINYYTRGIIGADKDGNVVHHRGRTPYRHGLGSLP